VRDDYNPGAWTPLFEGTAGAASLTGLLFVAVSIDLSAILQSKVLPRRARGDAVAVDGLLFLSVLMLVPGPSRTTLGLELTCLGVAIGAPLLARLRIARSPDDPLVWIVGPPS
jgi:modulator of FtsH protease